LIKKELKRLNSRRKDTQHYIGGSMGWMDGLHDLH